MPNSSPTFKLMNYLGQAADSANHHLQHVVLSRAAADGNRGFAHTQHRNHDKLSRTMAQRFFQLDAEIPVLGGHVDNLDDLARLRQEGVPGNLAILGWNGIHHRPPSLIRSETIS